MSYALLNNDGTVAKWPIDPREEFPGVSFALPYNDSNLHPFNMVAVVDAPNMASETQDGTYAVELVDGTWKQVWTYMEREV